MTLNELVAEVNLLTKRPDLVPQVESAIKAATLKTHQANLFPQDVLERHITFGTEAYVHSIDYMSIVPNFRTFKYLVKVDPSSGTGGVFLTLITPEAIFGHSSQYRVDVCYIAGRQLEVRSSTSVKDFIFACYVSPIVTSENFSSWVADIYPYVIIYEAARVISARIGNTAEADEFRVLAKEYLFNLESSAMPNEGE